MATKTHNNATNVPSFTGSVAFFPTSNAPPGWLKADGSAVSRTTYADLFAIIGTEHGAGDGSTTFNLPDLRGEFIRGWDDGKGVDAGRTNNSSQDHDWKSFIVTTTGSNTHSYTHGPVDFQKSTTTFNGRFFTGGWRAPACAIGAKWGTEEVRPRNVALLVCIKT